MLLNLTIIQMHSSDNKPTGVIQIINREHVLNKQEFMVIFL